jgi:hypothetical protein
MRIFLLCIAVTMMFIVGLYPHDDDALNEYSHHDYQSDVNWCIEHGYEFRSDAINAPVTCLKNGLDVAIPPNSLNLAKEKP